MGVLVGLGGGEQQAAKPSSSMAAEHAPMWADVGWCGSRARRAGNLRSPSEARRLRALNGEKYVGRPDRRDVLAALACSRPARVGGASVRPQSSGRHEQMPGLSTDLQVLARGDDECPDGGRRRAQIPVSTAAVVVFRTELDAEEGEAFGEVPTDHG